MKKVDKKTALTTLAPRKDFEDMGKCTCPGNDCTCKCQDNEVDLVTKVKEIYK